MPEKHPLGYRVARACPPLDVSRLPPDVDLKLEAGGFWLYNRRNGVRYRRVTMDDLPPKTHWAMTGRRNSDSDD